MTWPAMLLVLLVCHLVGDVLLQTEWQAGAKTRGFPDSAGRRALSRHVLTYLVAFIPALVWIGEDRSVARAFAVGVLVLFPHVIIDDGRLVRSWLRVIKRARSPDVALLIAVDQSFHVLCLFGTALLATV